MALANRLDTDSDGDGIRSGGHWGCGRRWRTKLPRLGQRWRRYSDAVEGTADTDGDGTPNYLDETAMEMAYLM